MEKKPLISISEEPISVLYESPSIMIVNKPRGIVVHPDNEKQTNTLLNRLFQDNRWLADMEDSLSAGVLHVFRPQDHGLMIFNKSDDYKESLQAALAENNVSFAYIIHVKDLEGTHSIQTDNVIRLKSSQQQAGFSIFDVETTEGNTSELADQLFPDVDRQAISFYCYSISLELPHSGEAHTTSLRQIGEKVPPITVYHAPP